ncbi:hypothetical protein GAU_1121 [Gemmatimonas aurantiaca T-27]|uniref:Ice-binding protein C-terminal domain-containing protein n=3 Tax=Gemmatimonas aurantiaca TaxID=173480 RepID=C1A7F3_GEMAT|nr:hypothetical protein GAU_1121 [Gemmatimonas aurantiaca T-27]
MCSAAALGPGSKLLPSSKKGSLCATSSMTKSSSLKEWCMKRAVLAGLVFLASSAVAGAQTVVVTGSGTMFTEPAGINVNDASCAANGEWCARNVRNGGAVGITNTYTRSGNGALEFSLPASGNSKADFDYLFTNANSSFVPFALSSLTSFGYDWFRDASSNNSNVQHPALRLYIDYDGAPGGAGGYLIYEGAYNGYDSGNPAPEGSWQSVDVSGNTTLWANRFGFGNCANMVDMHSFADWQSGAYGCGGVDIMTSAVVYGFSVGVGSGWFDGFNGAVDNVRFQTSNMSEAKVYNFEVATTVPEPSTYALMAAGLAGLLAVNRRRTRQAK